MLSVAIVKVPDDQVSVPEVPLGVHSVPYNRLSRPRLGVVLQKIISTLRERRVTRPTTLSLGGPGVPPRVYPAYMGAL